MPFMKDVVLLYSLWLKVDCTVTKSHLVCIHTSMGIVLEQLSSVISRAN